MSEDDPLTVLHEVRSRQLNKFKAAKDELDGATVIAEKASQEMNRLAHSIKQYDEVLAAMKTETEVPTINTTTAKVGAIHV